MTDQHLITAEYFDDALTYAVIGAVGERLALDRDAALEAFGRHWIAYAGASAFARVMAMAGGDIETFIENLDRMHASIKSTMPMARMPHFALLSTGPDAVVVLYDSEREGLGPFVRGILQAVAERFGESMTIEASRAARGIVFTMRRRQLDGARPKTDAA